MIRTFRDSDKPEWLRMRRALWPALASDAVLEARDGEQWLARKDAAIFVFDPGISDRLGGFLEVGERPFADGCNSSPVGFIEGWYVDPAFRGQGIGRALMRAAEHWSLTSGYCEIASDTHLESSESQAAHLKAGFAEVERVVRYKKAIK